MFLFYFMAFREDQSAHGESSASTENLLEATNAPKVSVVFSVLTCLDEWGTFLIFLVTHANVLWFSIVTGDKRRICRHVQEDAQNCGTTGTVPSTLRCVRSRLSRIIRVRNRIFLEFPVLCSLYIVIWFERFEFHILYCFHDGYREKFWKINHFKMMIV